jgi:D-3-phosphoglycerate dehydrogenase
VLFIFSHRDRPGMIGVIGSAFGRHDVNIAAMNLGRTAPGGEAVGVLNLDSLPPPEAVAAATAHEHIFNYCVVKLPPADETPAWLG